MLLESQSLFITILHEWSSFYAIWYLFKILNIKIRMANFKKVFNGVVNISEI